MLKKFEAKPFIKLSKFLEMNKVPLEYRHLEKRNLYGDGA
jgi:hypothetical protein